MPHIHEKIDFTVEVFVVYNKKVLLRKHDKYGIWLSVGGHIELDEDPNEAAKREVQEEVGLAIQLYDTREYLGDEDITQLVSPVAMNRHSITETHERVTLVYFARSAADAVIPENDADEWMWCTREDIDMLDNLRGDIAFYAKKALTVLG